MLTSFSLASSFIQHLVSCSARSAWELTDGYPGPAYAHLDEDSGTGVTIDD